jgi:hypothetical protein
MDQLVNRETGNLHMYQDQTGKLFYLVENIDDNVGMFVDAEIGSMEGMPLKKGMKPFCQMQHIKDIPYDQSNGTKSKNEQTITYTTKSAKSKWNGWVYAVIILSIIFFLIYGGIHHSENKKKDRSINNSEKIKQNNTDLNDIIWKDYNRVIGLLSVKYSFDDSIVKASILEYLRINEPAKYDILTMYNDKRDTTVYNYILKPKESINVTIQRLNSQFGISKDTISSLLLDFEVWLQTKEYSSSTI